MTEPKKREKFQAMKAAVQRKRDEQAAKPKVMPSADTVKVPCPNAITAHNAAMVDPERPSTWTAKPKKQRPPRKPFQADAEIHQKGRFPAGTEIVGLRWDGEIWRATLIFPTTPAGLSACPAEGSCKAFTMEDTALHRLFVRLYAEYRKWADAQPKEVPSGPPE